MQALRRVVGYAAVRYTSASTSACGSARVLSTGWRSVSDVRSFSSDSAEGKIVAPPMCYFAGEEMTRYTMALILDKWIYPNVDTTAWEYYDLSCKSRDDTNDQVLADGCAAGARVKSIFKEPTITPSEAQRVKFGLKNVLGSPNGMMRRSWNGITISRDTIHIKGIELGYKSPVLFDRHAVGGEYGASYEIVGKGQLKMSFTPEGGEERVLGERRLVDSVNAAVLYHNPLDNITDLAHHFFGRCLEARVVPYVVTKKTVFKWQDEFWKIMKTIYDAEYKAEFQKHVPAMENGELKHLISDAATMLLVRWKDGGFGMVAHNYDGDMLTDEVSAVHRSPGFITSSLIGKADDGTMIKEFEASHGTVTDMWDDHLAGKETSMNPLGLVEALCGAMEHSAAIYKQSEPEIKAFTTAIRDTIHQMMAEGRGTRDLCGPNGLTTEDFIDGVAEALKQK